METNLQADISNVLALRREASELRRQRKEAGRRFSIASSSSTSGTGLWRGSIWRSPQSSSAETSRAEAKGAEASETSQIDRPPPEAKALGVETSSRRASAPAAREPCPQVSIGVLRKWFDQMDVDRNGHVGRLQWRRFIRRHPRIGSLILNRASDRRSSHLLDETLSNNPRARMLLAEARSIRRRLRLFDDVDLDGNGSIDWTQFVQLFRERGILLTDNETAEPRAPLRTLKERLEEEHLGAVNPIVDSSSTDHYSSTSSHDEATRARQRKQSNSSRGVGADANCVQTETSENKLEEAGSQSPRVARLVPLRAKSVANADASTEFSLTRWEDALGEALASLCTGPSSNDAVKGASGLSETASPSGPRSPSSPSRAESTASFIVGGPELPSPYSALSPRSPSQSPFFPASRSPLRPLSPRLPSEH